MGTEEFALIPSRLFFAPRSSSTHLIGLDFLEIWKNELCCKNDGLYYGVVHFLFWSGWSGHFATRDGGDAPENSGRIDMHAIHRQFREIVWINGISAPYDSAANQHSRKIYFQHRPCPIPGNGPSGANPHAGAVQLSIWSLRIDYERPKGPKRLVGLRQG